MASGVVSVGLDEQVLFLEAFVHQVNVDGYGVDVLWPTVGIIAIDVVEDLTDCASGILLYEGEDGILDP